MEIWETMGCLVGEVIGGNPLLEEIWCELWKIFLALDRAEIWCLDIGAYLIHGASRMHMW